MFWAGFQFAIGAVLGLFALGLICGIIAAAFTLPKRFIVSLGICLCVLIAGLLMIVYNVHFESTPRFIAAVCVAAATLFAVVWLTKLGMRIDQEKKTLTEWIRGRQDGGPLMPGFWLAFCIFLVLLAIPALLLALANLGR